MYPHVVRIAAVTLVLVVCRAGTDQGQATVIREGKGAIAIPAVEAGGHHLTSSKPPPIPYSLIGAIQTENHWYPACVAWPWHMLRSFSLHRHGGLHRVHATLFSDDFTSLPPLP